MNKSELVDSVASTAGVDKRQAESVLRSFFETVTTETKRGNKVGWPGFGNFSTTKRAARQGRNPQTGEKVRIKAANVMRFSASSVLKEELNGRGGKKAAAKKTTARKTTAKKAPAKKAAAKKAPAKKAAAKKAPAKKTAARKTTAKKVAAKR